MSEMATTSRKPKSSRVPKYVSIAEAVKADIASGALAPNDRLPSFGSMTKQFNVTIHTIDKAHSMLEQEGFIRREPGRGVFVEPKRIERTGNMGLLLRKTDTNNAYTRSLLNGIQEQARECGLNVMLIDEDDPTITSKTDGVLLYCRSCDVATLKLQPSTPRVLILEPATNVEIANVVADDAGGAKLATQHLLQQGHTRISYMPSFAGDPYAKRRMEGYQTALKEAGIAFDASLCREVYATQGAASNDTEAAMRQWLQEGWRSLGSTALLAPNDEGVYGILRALDEAGLRVPGDVSIVGFDGVQPPQLGASQLTTIEVPLHAIGAAGVKLLWEQIQNGGHAVQKIVAPVQLRIGTSTAPP